MEIGISMFGDLKFDKQNNSYQSSTQRINEIIEEVKLMDEVGLDVFGIGEHHRKDYAVSTPDIILAGVATVTKNIKLTSAVTVLSSNDPVRVYQSFSTIDAMSNGRAEITVGRGSFIESFPLFGYDLNDYNELFTEKLNLLLNINAIDEPLTWTGKHRASLKEQQVFPRSEQPMDIWIAAGGTPESVLRAAKLGLPLVFAIIGGMPEQYKPFFDYYKQEYINAGHDISKMQIATHSHGLVGVDGNALAKDYFPVYKEQMDRIGASRGWQPYTYEQYEGGRSRDGALFIGDVDQVVDKILYHQEMFGLTRWLMHSDLGAPDHLTQMKNIELLGTKIAPAVKKALRK
ncbi:LLM class flavin-dependent oxidoreductase [Myroides profundi]|uniref:Probable oxidoreductase, LLM family n=1 Tax=Myroides profundi TaxID=480520 RepID=A0AAJ5BCW3_MYRPR|nr:LLM class flavin-dependent oxidoreductase [Myroides profundi]AJH14862.1 luciferase [Myroides profundi]SEQ25525.1 probable oxidoreductase, LLM family [Myroides profundi]